MLLVNVEQQPDVACTHPASADLMKSSPELMTEALNLHNGLMRKVRWENCGFTVEQEGDSYTFVFYTAVDAAAFCLQVGATSQQAHAATAPSLLLLTCTPTPVECSMLTC